MDLQNIESRMSNLEVKTFRSRLRHSILLCSIFIIRLAIWLRPLAAFVVTRGFGMSGHQRQIIHLDMDAFYPSVEVLDQPGLKGRAVIVGGGRKRGVVSSASYEARKYGVHSAQPMAEAMRLCPHGVFLPVRMSRYKEVSRKVFEIYQRFTPLLEPLSIDEAFLDVTGSLLLFGSAVEMAAKIKEAVQREVGLTASAGVAPSKFVAKIASDMEKPDGLTVVEPDGVRAFLSPLPVSKMWGVGKVTQAALKDLGVNTFGDLSRFPTGASGKEIRRARPAHAPPVDGDRRPGSGARACSQIRRT